MILSAGLLWLASFTVTAPPEPFQSARAWEDLLKQVSFGPRTPGSPGHIKCRDWIQAEMAKNCDNVRLQEFSHRWTIGRREVKMWNIVGEQNWKEAKTRVLLIAHWDTRPTADQEYESSKRRQPILGANDGASGVAVLLELMRVLKTSLPKDVGVQYLITDGEDLGPGLDEMFLGARAYAKKLPEPRPDYGILLDMIGDRELEVPMEPNSLRYAPRLVRALYAHARTVGLERTFPQIEGPTIEDDHIPLNEAGLKTIDLIDFDYPHWHTLDDTADKCSAASLGKVGKLLETWLQKQPPYTGG